MTSYTKVTDSTTSYTPVANITTGYTDVTDGSTVFGMFGGLLYLATEGARDRIMSEGELDYIVVSKDLESGAYTNVADVSTSYTKVADA